jgi:hypothetical protein
MAKKKKAETFPTKEALFDGAFRNLVNNLGTPDTTSSQPAVDTYIRLGISGPNVYTPLVNLLGTPTTVNSWEYVYPLVMNKSTYTVPLKNRKNAIMKSALEIIRPERVILKKQNKLNPGFLTENDLAAWYIPLPNPLTPSMDATLTLHPVPAVSIHEIKSMQHVVDTVDPKSPKSNSLPAGMQFVWLKYFIGATPPADHNQYTHVCFSGKFRHVATFLSTYQKQQVWYIAAYISTTGVLGEFSAPISTNIA